ncbi:hypothetical protein EDD18DRAFT_1169333, partial [Armillaria luteobubalina]
MWSRMLSSFLFVFGIYGFYAYGICNIFSRFQLWILLSFVVVSECVVISLLEPCGVELGILL